MTFAPAKVDHRRSNSTGKFLVCSHSLVLIVGILVDEAESVGMLPYANWCHIICIRLMKYLENIKVR